MVAAVRGGVSQRAVARQFGVGLATVALWVGRARGQPLERADWADRSSRPHRVPQRTPLAMEALVLETRRELKEQSALGEFGAVAIQRALRDAGQPVVPAVRTIGRILERRGALDRQQRVRRRPPPTGWYLPAVAARQAEVDSIDVVEGLVIKGGPEVVVLTAISVHGGLSAAWPATAVSARSTVDALTAHWREVGLPAYAQFDNDPRFQGPHQHTDVVGRVMRLCLSLAIVPVFAPPRESGFQASIESFNGRWPQKVWARFQHDSLAALAAQSAAYITASRRLALRIEGAPPRRVFPPDWQLDLHARPHGRIVFLRRTSERGAVELLGHTFTVDPSWVHRLVRSEVDLTAGELRFYALRRQAPAEQPLLRTLPYQLPQRPFRD
jgi:leucine-zipper of insertion element IS481